MFNKSSETEKKLSYSFEFGVFFIHFASLIYAVFLILFGFSRFFYATPADLKLCGCCL